MLAFPCRATRSSKLASIIEKESKLDEERPKIASVFYNRMKSPEAYQRRLESCATVRYALNKKTGIITYKDTRVNSPYNTYVVLGMPPTPISNPGIKSMEAALNPRRPISGISWQRTTANTRSLKRWKNTTGQKS